MTTRAEAIRAWLATQDGLRSPGAIADALGCPAACRTDDGKQTDRMRLHWTVGEMHRKGLLVRTGSRSTGFLYGLGRPVTVRLTPEELRERRNARERARYAARRTGMTAEEYNAWRAEQAAEKRAWREKQRAQQAALGRARAVVQKMRADAAKPKPKPAPKPRRPGEISIPPKPTPLHQPAPKVERFETVEEWMRRTGRTPEILPPPGDGRLPSRYREEAAA